MNAYNSCKSQASNTKNVRLLIWTLFVSLVLSSCNDTPSEKIEPKAPIVGTWKLIEFSNLDSETGEWTYRYGKNPKGYFTYTKSNIVNLNISDETPMELDVDSSRTKKFTHHELFLNSVGYFGKYSVDYDKSIITHYPEGGSLPWYIGTNQERPFLLKGDTLIIGNNKTYKRILIKVD